MDRDSIEAIFNDDFSGLEESWGLRGDPYLWEALKQYFLQHGLPSSSINFSDQLKSLFLSLTDHSLDDDTIFHKEEFAHGGMSSGYISPINWRKSLIPLLMRRFDDLRAN